MRINPKINPLTWSDRTIKIIMASFFAIVVPAYIIIGLQPSSDDAIAISMSSSAVQNDLVISSIDLSTPVEVLSVDGRELEAPDEIAGSYNRNKNKTLLIGHSSTVFKDLRNVNIDDKITYLGKTFTIQKLETLAKPDIKMTEILAGAEQNTIILMTCAGHHLTGQDYSHRLIVTATED